jgi:hypothetical protein
MKTLSSLVPAHVHPVVILVRPLLTCSIRPKVVPGSHLWEDARSAQEHEFTTAELSRGEALLFLSSTLHAGGANTTPDPRTMYAIFYCRSWVRPEVTTCPPHILLQVQRDIDPIPRRATLRAIPRKR